MKKTRYFIQHVPRGQTPALANMSRQYHYVDLGRGYIFGVANVSPADMQACDACHRTVLLPSLYSSKTIKALCDEQEMSAWFDALVPFGILPTDTCQQVVEKICERTGHPHLEPDK